MCCILFVFRLKITQLYNAIFTLRIFFRSDKGMEDVGVCDFMLAGRGLDVFFYWPVRSQPKNWETFARCIVKVHCTLLFQISVGSRSYFWHSVVFFPKYYYFFSRRWEGAGILEPGDEFDVQCLHFVCMGLIDTALEDFPLMWNNHNMRTHCWPIS